MKQVPFLELLQVFFLDFVGLVVPGAALLIGSQALLSWVPDTSAVHLLPPDGFGWTILIVGGYVLGHAVNGIGTSIVTPLLGFLCIARTEDRLWPQIREKRGFAAVVEHRGMGELPNEKDKARRYCHSVRNVAMTIITERDRQLIHKFRFIALLNQGAATVLLVLIVLAGTLTAVNALGLAAVSVNAPVWFWFVCPLLIVPFTSQQSDFHRRSLGVCFDMALAVLEDDAGRQGAPHATSDPAAERQQLLAKIGELTMKKERDGTE